MKIKLAAVALAAAFAFVAAKAWAQRAESAPESPAMTLIGSTRDTNVYFVNYAGHNCFIASTRGGSGVSVTCPK